MKIIGNIRQAIEENGSITMAQFMSEAMYNLNEGYYVHSDPIGRGGDFVTAPEISQLFGEMIGVYAADAWEKLGKPKKFNLVELGPGKATLMLDLLRATKNVEGFHNACSINLVETNQRLVKIQEERLSQYKIPCQWHNDVLSLPQDTPLIIIANEFFDCLPINQYIRDKDDWYERSVTINYQEFEIIKTMISSALSVSLSSDHPNSKHLAVVEICYPAIKIMQHIAEIFNKVPGYLLAIDYGYDVDPRTRTSYNYTLQAVKNHRYHPIFSDIGRADLTAHVDFYALKQTALAHSCQAIGSISQGEFLRNLGINIRFNLLSQHADISQKEEMQSALNRLTNPDQMGELFKAISTYSQGLKKPIGF